MMNYLVSKQQPNETTSVELMIIMSEWKENQPKKCVQQGFNGMYSKVKKTTMFEIRNVIRISIFYKFKKQNKKNVK